MRPNRSTRSAVSGRPSTDGGAAGSRRSTGIPSATGGITPAYGAWLGDAVKVRLTGVVRRLAGPAALALVLPLAACASIPTDTRVDLVRAGCPTDIRIHTD